MPIISTDELRQDPRTICKNEVKAIRKKLPKNVSSMVMTLYPEYNTVKGYNLINNVLSGRSADVKLTEILKSIATL